VATPLSLYWLLSLPQVRALANAEDLAALQDEVVAWRQVYELADGHRDTLMRYRNFLVLDWKGKAAGVFLAEMDRQIDSLKDAAEVALANERQASVAAYSLQDTQERLAGLDRQWQAAGGDNPSPATAVAAGPQRDQITRLAQQALETHAQTVVDASEKLLPAVRYQVPKDDRWADGPPVVPRGGSNTGPGWPSRLPGVAPNPPAEVAEALAVLAGGVAPAPTPVDATLPITSDPGAAPRGLGAWFVDTPAGRALRYGAVIGLPLPEPPTRPTAVPGQRPGGATVDPRGVAGSPLPGAGFGAPIGGVPRPQQPQTYKGMRVAPPGGLVGPRPAAAAGGGEVHTTANGSTFTVSNNGNAAGVTKWPTTPVGWGKKLQRKRGPDDLWSVAEGVPPVIYPPPEPYHDPGPGVFGIDR